MSGIIYPLVYLEHSAQFKETVEPSNLIYWFDLSANAKVFNTKICISWGNSNLKATERSSYGKNGCKPGESILCNFRKEAKWVKALQSSWKVPAWHPTGHWTRCKIPTFLCGLALVEWDCYPHNSRKLAIGQPKSIHKNSRVTANYPNFSVLDFTLRRCCPSLELILV